MPLRTGLSELDDRANFDRAVPRSRNLRCHRNGFVEVGTLEQVEAGERLFGFGVRAVAGHDVAALAALDAHGRRGGGLVQGVSATDHGSGSLTELVVVLHDLPVLGQRPVDVLAVDECGVHGHGLLLGCGPAPVVGCHLRDERPPPEMDTGGGRVWARAYSPVAAIQGFVGAMPKMRTSTTGARQSVGIVMRSRIFASPSLLSGTADVDDWSPFAQASVAMTWVTGPVVPSFGPPVPVMSRPFTSSLRSPRELMLTSLTLPTVHGAPAAGTPSMAIFCAAGSPTRSWLKILWLLSWSRLIAVVPAMAEPTNTAATSPLITRMPVLPGR